MDEKPVNILVNGPLDLTNGLNAVVEGTSVLWQLSQPLGSWHSWSSKE